MRLVHAGGPAGLCGRREAPQERRVRPVIAARRETWHPRPVDVLSDVLETVRLRSLATECFSMNPPWGFRAAQSEDAVFFAFTRGHGWLEVDGAFRGEPRRVDAGDIVFIPRGNGHTMRDDTSTEPIDARVFRAGSQAQEGRRRASPVRMIGGCFPLVGGRQHPVIAVLPTVLHLRRAEGEITPYLEATVRLLEAEVEAGGQGAVTVLNRLAEVLFIQVVRAHLMNLPEGKSGWLRGLTDPRIAAAMRAMHLEPERDWTVVLLARRAGMSRSAFASRFAELVGETPAQYLARWRIERAAALMRDAGATAKTAAAQVGYTSHSAFRRVFKKWLGVSPTAFRQRQAGRERKG